MKQLKFTLFFLVFICSFIDISAQSNTALDFDGTNDYVEVPHSPDLTLTGGDFAFEAWIYPTDGSYKTILSKGHGSNYMTNYVFGIMDDNDTFFNQPGKLGLFLGDIVNYQPAEWQFSNTSIPLNQWSHVAVSVDQSSFNVIATFYFNGTVDGIKTYTLESGFLYDTGNSPLYIGKQGENCNCNYFKGGLDKVGIWNKQLSAADIATSMSQSYTGTEANLVAYYNFNDGDACINNSTNTALIDLTSNNHHGTLINFDLSIGCSSNWTKGHSLNTALDFDGTDDYVEVPHRPDIILTGSGDDFAFEAWVYPTDGSYKTILSKGHGSNYMTNYAFGIIDENDTFFNQPGKLGLFLADINNSIPPEWQFSNTSIPLNQWTHVAVSVDLSSNNVVATFYFNGAVDGIKTYALESDFLYYAGNSPLYIGRQGENCNCNYFKGGLDEVGIWNKQLSAADIATSMSQSYNGTEANLVAYYNFNDGDACLNNSTNTALINLTSNNHNGTLINFDLSTGCSSNWTQGHSLACPSNYTGANSLSGTPSGDTDYETAGNIESNQIITSPLVIDYDASSEIELQPGFEVRAGALFQAFIDGCGNLFNGEEDEEK